MVVSRVTSAGMMPATGKHARLFFNKTHEHIRIIIVARVQELLNTPI